MIIYICIQINMNEYNFIHINLYNLQIMNPYLYLRICIDLLKKMKNGRKTTTIKNF